MDYMKGVRGATATALKIAAVAILILVFGCLIAYEFESMFPDSTISFLDILAGNWFYFIPLVMMIPLSFAYNLYEPGMRRRLMLRIASCLLFVGSILLLTSGLEYTVDSITLSGTHGIYAYGTDVSVAIAPFRLLLLPLPVLEALYSVAEYRSNQESRASMQPSWF